MSARIASYLRGNVLGLIAIFIALGGTAIALPGQNTVQSGDIGPGEQVRNGDTKPIQGSWIEDNSLTGADVDESTLAPGPPGPPSGPAGGDLTGTYPNPQVNEGSLGQVPSAALGGYGRSVINTACDPGSHVFIDCGFTTLNLPSATRVLMIASATEYGGGTAGGCRLVTSSGEVTGTRVNIHGGQHEVIALTAVTGIIPGGSRDFGLECNQELGDAKYHQISVSAVALSAN
jgi:hypothetical protein